MAPYLTELTVDQWGPTVWKLLHVLSTRIGGGDEVTDADAANMMFFVVNQLSDVLPCKECAAHTKTYLAEHKFAPRGLVGARLRDYIETWLFEFHNAVRVRKSQPILISDIGAYHDLWSRARILPCDDEALTLFFNYGKMFKIVDLTKFTRWNNQLKRLRLLLSV